MEPQSWVAVIVAALALVGSYIAFRGTKGRTQSDAKTAFDQRVDEKMSEYTDRLESRLNGLEDRRDQLEARVQELEESHKRSTHREHVLYRYVAALRNHIIEGLKPPPPAVPDELAEWYDSFDVNSTRGLA